VNRERPNLRHKWRCRRRKQWRGGRMNIFSRGATSATLRATCEHWSNNALRKAHLARLPEQTRAWRARS